MSAATETLGSDAESQALAIRNLTPRASLSDLVVVAVALALIVVGAALKDFLDNRVVTVAIDGISVAYPRGWFTYPTDAPAQLHAVSNQDGATTIWLFVEPAGGAGLFEAVVSGIGNPAAGETAYTPLSNERTELDGTPTLRTEYAYVVTTIGGATPPEVIRGEQLAWLGDDTIHVLALEAPDAAWDESRGLFERVVAELRIS